MKYCHVESPIGPLLLAGEDSRLRLISFPSGSRAREPWKDWERDESAFSDVIGQLCEYFDGARTEFTLPLDCRGTAFQNAVWTMLQAIPYGETTSYGALAARLGDQKLSRAVGAANGDNPLPIVIPCHRVIGADGSLTGFGGGLPTKKFLLALEQRVKPRRGLQYSLFA